MNPKHKVKKVNTTEKVLGYLTFPLFCCLFMAGLALLFRFESQVMGFITHEGLRTAALALISSICAALMLSFASQTCKLSLKWIKSVFSWFWSRRPFQSPAPESHDFYVKRGEKELEPEIPSGFLDAITQSHTLDGPLFDVLDKQTEIRCGTPFRALVIDKDDSHLTPAPDYTKPSALTEAELNERARLMNEVVVRSVKRIRDQEMNRVLIGHQKSGGLFLDMTP